MGRKAKVLRAKRKTKPATRSAKKTTTSTSAIKKIKDYDRCKKWLVEQKNATRQPVPLHDINDDENSEIDNDLCRLDAAEKPESSLRGKARLNIQILCEWKRCRTESQNLNEFRQHVDQHINNIPPQEMYDCHWDLCSYKTKSIEEITTHIGYHVYHTNLKNVGECFLKSKNNLPPCLLDSRCRNLIPDEANSYECKWDHCDRKFLKICDFMEHIREHGDFEAKMRNKYKSKEMKCNWVGCDKVYTVIATFTDHRRSHTKEKQCGCPNCGSLFRNFSKFYDHFRRQSTTNEFQCSHCFKYFFSMELLRNHQHVHVNRYKCTMCDMTTPSPSALVQHIRYRHVKSKPFSCSQCDYGAIYKHDLEKHILAVHKDEDTVYECQQCDFTTDKLHMLRKHKNKIHCSEFGEKIYCCHLCPKKYDRGYFLSNHLIKKHEFQLPFGHRRFIYRQDLDGFYHVQLTRTESLEVTQQIMLPTQRDTTDSIDMTYDISDLQTSKNGFSIKVARKPKEPTTTAPIFYDSSNDANLFFTLPDLNFDSNSEENEVRSKVDDNEGKKDEMDVVNNEDVNIGSSSPIKSPEHISDFEGSALDIKNFSVMRYLKKEKKNNIIIELKEVDETGAVVKTRIVQADEFSVTTNSDKSIAEAVVDRNGSNMMNE